MSYINALIKWAKEISNDIMFTYMCDKTHNINKYFCELYLKNDYIHQSIANVHSLESHEHAAELMFKKLQIREDME